MILAGRQPVKLQPRADFKPEEFRKRIFSHGLNVRWEQAAECPCNEPAASGGFSATLAGAQHGERRRSDCPACDGRGYIYHSRQTLRAIVTGARKTDERFSQVGGSEYPQGQIGLTLLPEHLPAPFDRFTLLDSEIVYRQTLTRSSTGDTDTPRYPIVQRTHDLATGPQTFGVRYCMTADPSGVVTPSTGRREEGQHFNITSAGEVEWTADAPEAGARYSLEYYAHPAYIVQGTPHSIRDSYINFKSSEPYHVALPVYAEAALEYYGAPLGADDV